MSANDLCEFIYLLGRLGDYFGRAKFTDQACAAYLEAIFIFQSFCEEASSSNFHNYIDDMRDIGDIFYCYGIQLLFARDYGLAASIFADAARYLSNDPSDQSVVAQAKLAMSLFYSGNSEAAAHVYLRLIAQHREDNHAHFRSSCFQDYGRALEAMFRGTDACEAYCEAIIIFVRLLIRDMPVTRVMHTNPRTAFMNKSMEDQGYNFTIYAYNIVKSLVLLAHCLLDSHRPTDAQTAYEYANSIPPYLKSLSMELFEIFTRCWDVPNELKGTFGQSYEEALESVSVRLSSDEDIGEGSTSSPRRNVNRKQVDVEFILLVCQVRNFAHRWMPPNEEWEESGRVG
jgi:hypothetical protein